MGGNACVSAVDGVLAADDVVIRGGRGETLFAPYARFYFVFVDDKPGANWAHPCRYVFISEDCTSFTILYKLWRPRLSVKATGERIGLQAVGEEPEINATSFEKIRESVYNYAAGLERNSLSYATGDKSKSYFVLISGGDDPESNGIRFWSDTAMFYSTLTKKYGESPSGFGSSFFMLKQTESGSTGLANDNFASATTISGVSGSLSGSNVGAMMETGETKPSAQSSSTGSVWYKWTAPASGNVTFDTIGSGFDTVLGVYTGTAVSSLTEVKSDDNSGDSSAHTSKLTSFQAVSGTTYRIAVYGYSNYDGMFNLNWNLAVSAGSYTVTFNANGGKIGNASYSSVQVERGKYTMQAGASGTKTTRTGYTLVGWYDTSAATGGNMVFGAMGYAADGKYWNGSYLPKVSSATWKYAGNVTAYARWAPSRYVVTLDANGGTIGAPSYASIEVEYGKYTMQAGASGAKATRAGYALAGWYDRDGNMVFDAKGYAANGKYWNGSYLPKVSSATWKYAGGVTAYARWTKSSNANAGVRKLSSIAIPEDDAGLFAPGEMQGVFADGEGMFALTLDEGLETAYLVTWTADGGITCECEATIADNTLLLTTEGGVVYRLAWEDGNLVATLEE